MLANSYKSISKAINWKQALASCVLLSTAALPANATLYDYENTTPHYAANDSDFRAAHPLRVFIKVGNPRRASDGRRHQEQKTERRFAHYLPGYVALVDSPQHADLVIRVRETDYDLNFRVIDIDQKDKKYKKKRRYVGGRCGVHHKAFYTKVKEKGEAYASYNVKVNLKGINRNSDRFTLRAAENFSYGTNLRASTNCGMQPTNHMPSNGVAKLFSKSNDDYRHHVARKIRREAIDNLGRKIAQRIHEQADHYYTDLAADLNNRHYYERDYDRDLSEREIIGLLLALYKDRPRQPNGGHGR